MLSDSKKELITGFTKEDIPLCEPISIMEFIENSLNEYNPSEPLKKETMLTQTLVRLLISKKHPIWIFDKENIYPNSNSSEDIAVSIESNLEEAVFLIEAKRLNSSFKREREREYVIGEIGGIERFKRNKHGKKLFHAGMIGYMQTDDFEDWNQKINKWISDEIISPNSSDLFWEEDDKLVKQTQSLKSAKYTSLHSRIDKDKIRIIHLWIKLN